MALTAGEAALGAEPLFLERLDEQKKERRQMWEELAELGLNPLPTETNFVCCDEPDQGTAAWLKERGVSVHGGASISSPGTFGSPSACRRTMPSCWRC